MDQRVKKIILSLGLLCAIAPVQSTFAVVKYAEETPAPPPPPPNPAQPEQKPEEKVEAKKPAASQKCTRHKGAVFYREYGTAMHRMREEAELSPAEWHTLLMGHRILIPWTADEYCSMVTYFSTKPSETPGGPPVPLDNLPNSNLLIKGSTAATLFSREHNNSTFAAVLDPIFFWRYKNRILFVAKFDVTLVNKETDITLVHANINYIMNDYLTARGGKFIIPLGFWREKMLPEWINKLATRPLPYADSSNLVIPAADLGLDVRGAVPLWNNPANPGVPMVLTYDGWIGNGPDQKSNGDISLNGTNYNDNNRNKAVGGRFCFRFWPDRQIGISGMYGQWNNNSTFGSVIAHRKLYYRALVGEWDWLFGQYLRFCGEYMWTKRGAVPNSKLGIHNHEVYKRALWAQLSSTLGFISHHYVPENIELVARYGQILTNIHHGNQFQWSFGANYYLTSKMIIKVEYDLNHGPANHNNMFSVQWAYGY